MKNEVRLDRTSLPKDGELVRWVDVNTEEEYEGFYDEESEQFLIGRPDDGANGYKFTWAGHVESWEPL